MTDQEILTKAIEKAMANGFSIPLVRDITPELYMRWLIQGVNSYQLIYNHDFAKALWGEEIVTIDPQRNNQYIIAKSYRWHYHLQQMVIADDPIEYLGKNI